MSEGQQPTKASQDGAAGATSSSGFSLWGFGSSLVNSVTQNANQFVNTIVETDWQKEFSDIQQGLKEDGVRLEKQVEEQLGIAEHSNATDRAQGAAASSTTTQPAEAATTSDGFSFAHFGQSLVTGTTELFETVKHTIDAELHSVTKEPKRKPAGRAGKSSEGKARFSRLDMEVKAMQRNASTYCDEPEDVDGYREFCEAFVMEEKKEEIQQFLNGNPFMSELHMRLVPLVVEDDVFWKRFFFRLHTIVQQHEKRQKVVQQAHKHAEDHLDWEVTEELATQSQSQRAASPTSPRSPPQAAAANGPPPASLDVSEAVASAAVDDVGKASEGASPKLSETQKGDTAAASSDDVEKESRTAAEAPSESADGAKASSGAQGVAATVASQLTLATAAAMEAVHDVIEVAADVARVDDAIPEAQPDAAADAVSSDEPGIPTQASTQDGTRADGSSPARAEGASPPAAEKVADDAAVAADVKTQEGQAHDTPTESQHAGSQQHTEEDSGSGRSGRSGAASGHGTTSEWSVVTEPVPGDGTVKQPPADDRRGPTPPGPLRGAPSSEGTLEDESGGFATGEGLSGPIDDDEDIDENWGSWE